MAREARLALSLVVLFVAAVACGDDSEPAPAPPGPDGLAACDEIGGTCHGVDEECHEIGHIREPEACLARYDECIALCTAGGGSGGGDNHGGAGGESHGHAGGESHGGAGGESHGGAGGESHEG